MAKVNISFRLDETIIDYIKQLSELDKRSNANMIEILIEAEAKKRKLKPKAS